MASLSKAEDVEVRAISLERVATVAEAQFLAEVAQRVVLMPCAEARFASNLMRPMGYPFGPFYQLLLLTAQRREEVAAMSWPEMKLGKTEGEWIIPKERTKNGKEHLVHLSPSVVSILYGLPTISKFVFTTNGTTPISGYSKAKAKLDKLIATECASLDAGQSANFCQQIFQSEWRVHDLRCTAASGMAELGFQPHIVERVLNHISGAQGGLVGVYQRFEYADERKRALEAWGNRVTEIASGKTCETNVVSLQERGGGHRP